MKKFVSRREILGLIAKAGASGAVLQASNALGIVPDSYVDIPKIPRVDSGNRQSVVVLGAGVGGLTAALELKKAGYSVVVLEAAGRAGGRNMTVRHGDLIDEVGNPQICDFDDEPHMYFNAGPARIPSSHRNVLHYCKELGVELEFFINENKETYIQDDAMLDGKPIKNREFTTNARGFMAEIMAKNFTNAELDQPFDEWEIEALMRSLRRMGDLDEDMIYRGSTRGGYSHGGFLEHGHAHETIALRDLLKSALFSEALSQNEGETGPMLFQPVGGMDQIIKGYLRKLPDEVFYNVMVTSVMLQNDGIEVVYEHKGIKYKIEADYCFNSIPTHLMTGIDNNFSADYKEAMAYPRRGEAYKSAFQAKERFWEKDDIFGGISWTNQPIEQIWYPPHGMYKEKGIILAAYNYGGGMHFTQLTQEERIETAIRQGEKVHPNYRGLVEKGITIAWHRMNHMLGCSARWQKSRSGFTQEEERLFQTLRQPAGNRHYTIGDQMTKHPAWQESAILSAHWAINDMLARKSGSTMPGQRV
ncbi:MAG: FAD-dependent oxidoreductase [OM182 bacterium]|jgi:monoamine oxidase|nr:FAD-dependent oxidoreductase [OM182 bacterium]MDP4783494.1 FAD-dependent oxidoreductase [Gammaproteobacteria bacterium]MDP4869463.1 FAD-dependent oxidoreductase [Gammaproteobacteria bacterium]MDP4943194.1 FAD-dependent oxidoreductase [OM182 bacterium]